MYFLKGDTNIPFKWQTVVVILNMTYDKVELGYYAHKANSTFCMYCLKILNCGILSIFSIPYQ